MKRRQAFLDARTERQDLFDKEKKKFLANADNAMSLVVDVLTEFNSTIRLANRFNQKARRNYRWFPNLEDKEAGEDISKLVNKDTEEILKRYEDELVRLIRIWGDSGGRRFLQAVKRNTLRFLQKEHKKRQLQIDEKQLERDFNMYAEDLYYGTGPTDEIDKPATRQWWRDKL